MMQPHVQLAAHNNAAEVALVQQHDGAAAAAVAHLRRSHVLGLQRAHCTECFHNFRSAAAQHRSVLEGHVIAAPRAVQPRSAPAYMLETALSMRASRSLGCQEADGRGTMPSFQQLPAA